MLLLCCLNSNRTQCSVVTVFMVVDRARNEQFVVLGQIYWTCCSCKHERLKYILVTVFHVGAWLVFLCKVSQSMCVINVKGVLNAAMIDDICGKNNSSWARGRTYHMKEKQR